MKNKINALIVGANGGIGLGFVRKLLQDEGNTKIYATYRRQQLASELKSLENRYGDRICCLEMDITDETKIERAIASIEKEAGKLHLAINCAGILHEGALQPEKSLKQINSEYLLRYFQINSIGAVLLAKHLLPLFRHGDRALLATLSAKLGSIGDNHLGGWYGYRASKAALNMFVRTIAIEYRRNNPNSIVVALHPGTTDTHLSQPFQKNVPTEKLFSIDRTVSQLLKVIENLNPKDSGQFFSWDGTPLPW